MPAGAAEGLQGEVVAVEVVVDHEAARQLAALRQPGRVLLQADALADSVAREAAANIIGFIPGAIVLMLQEPSDAALDSAIIVMAAESQHRKRTFYGSNRNSGRSGSTHPANCRSSGTPYCHLR